MTPAQIIVASCLGVAPLLLGFFIGRTLAALYEARNDFFGRQENFLGRFWIEYEYVIHRRQSTMVVFWTAIGAASGGFLAGSYMQAVWPWWHTYLGNLELLCC